MKNPSYIVKEIVFENNLKLIHFCRLSDGDKPFEARVKIPQLQIKSDYRSAGVLIILPASGGGELTGTFGKTNY